MILEELKKNKSNAISIFYGLLLSSNGFFFGFGMGLFSNFAKDYLEEVHNITETRIQN